jgi:outer membrane protein TolC
MALTGYKEGTITNLDLTNTQKLYTQTEMEYLKALYNFYIAKVNLFKSIGKLKEDLSWLDE